QEPRLTRPLLNRPVSPGSGRRGAPRMRDGRYPLQPNVRRRHAYELAILGPVFAAFAAAATSTDAGVLVMIERGTVGGTCVNTGCAPSRALLAAAGDLAVGHALGLGLGAVPGVELGGGGAGSSHRLGEPGWSWLAVVTPASGSR